MALTRTILALAVIATTGLLAGCGDDQSSSDSASSPTPERGFQATSTSGANQGEVSIDNQWNFTINCTIPRYKGGSTFEVDGNASRPVRAANIDGEKVINEVTCQGKRVEGLKVTPTSDGVGLELLGNGTFRKSGYTYVHAHLKLGSYLCHSQTGATVDWASSESGQCGGNYIGGAAPFDGSGDCAGGCLPGVSTWVKNGNEGFRIIQALNVGSWDKPRPGTAAINCFITARNSDACYTDYLRDQMGKTPGTQGGPLSLNVRGNVSAPEDRFVLLKGWCQNSDNACTPHTP